MTSLGTRNGYTRLPTEEPDDGDIPNPTNYGVLKTGPHRDLDAAVKLNNPRGSKGRKKTPVSPLPSRPGLFYMFGDRGKYAANHVSVAIASQSESEHEAERIELTELKAKRPKHRRGRLKSSGSNSAKSPKAKSRPRLKFTIIEEPVLPGDTLERVALRYNCPSSEIRRANNLYSSQDFFALKTVKIPVREHGILTEPQAREKCRKNNVDEPYHSSGGATSDDLRLGGPNSYYKSDEEEEKEELQGSSVDADDEIGYDSDSPEVRDVSIHSALKWKHSQRALLDKFGEELKKVRENTEQRLANLNEVTITMTSPTILPIVQKKNSFEKNLLSINWDWRVIIIAGVLLLGALTICIVGYIIIKSRT